VKFLKRLKHDIFDTIKNIGTGRVLNSMKLGTKHRTVHLSQGLTIYIPDKGIRYNQLECLRYGTNINEFLDINGSL